MLIVRGDSRAMRVQVELKTVSTGRENSPVTGALQAQQTCHWIIFQKKIAACVKSGKIRATTSQFVTVGPPYCVRAYNGQSQIWV